MRSECLGYKNPKPQTHLNPKYASGTLVQAQERGTCFSGSCLGFIVFKGLGFDLRTCLGIRLQGTRVHDSGGCFKLSGPRAWGFFHGICLGAWFRVKGLRFFVMVIISDRGSSQHLKFTTPPFLENSNSYLHPTSRVLITQTCGRAQNRFESRAMSPKP